MVHSERSGMGQEGLIGMPKRWREKNKGQCRSGKVYGGVQEVPHGLGRMCGCVEGATQNGGNGSVQEVLHR